MCMWPFLVTSLRNEVVRVLAKPGGRRHPLSPPPPRAVENLSTSLFVKEYFAQVSFALVLEISSQTSGVLLASKLCCVLI